MKTSMIGVLCAGLLATINVARAVTINDSVRMAYVQGGEAKIIFKVVDDDGNAVPNAHIEIGFFMAVLAPGEFKGMTDANGQCIVSGRCSGEIYYYIKKMDIIRRTG